jgi:hypothetical protein
MSEEKTILEQTVEVLERVQAFDLTTLQRADLGPFNFGGAIQPAHRVVALFKRIPSDVLKDLPQGPVNAIRNRCIALLAQFDQISAFDAAQANPMDVRNGIISNLQQLYDAAFSDLHQWIAYSASKTTDFVGLANEGRSALEKINELTGNAERALDDRLKKVGELEEQLRQSLAEQGVGKQAAYFASEAVEHKQEAAKWGNRTWSWAIAVATLAFASFFAHKIPWLAPSNSLEAVQFVASKLLLFGVLTFMLVRSSRNHSAHKHNEVANRHKQNSLLTFNALVEAGSTPDARNTVLNHASASIYAAPDTGYGKSRSESGPSNLTLVELLPKASAKIGDTSTS